jgi:hypothetical protein
MPACVYVLLAVLLAVLLVVIALELDHDVVPVGRVARVDVMIIVLVAILGNDLDVVILVALVTSVVVAVGLGHIVGRVARGVVVLEIRLNVGTGLASPIASLLVSASLSRRFFGRAWMPVASVLLVLPTLAFHVHPRSFSRSSMRSADRRIRPFLHASRWSLIHPPSPSDHPVPGTSCRSSPETPSARRTSIATYRLERSLNPTRAASPGA